jgi:hypothetical protein
MTALNFPIVQQSDWSMPESVTFQHPPTNNTTKQYNAPSDKVFPFNDDQNHLSNNSAQSWSYMSPVFQGFFMGVITGCLILTVALPLWLASSVNTTTGRCFELFLFQALIRIYLNNIFINS